MRAATVENCDLLRKGRDLAKKRGLPLKQVVCVLAQACLGPYCIMASDISEDTLAAMGERRVDKFYGKLERWQGIRTAQKNNQSSARL